MYLKRTSFTTVCTKPQFSLSTSKLFFLRSWEEHRERRFRTSVSAWR